MVGIGILSWIGLGLLGGFIAAKKGYPPTAGVLVGMFFGPVGLVVAAVMPQTARGREQEDLEYLTEAQLAHSNQTRACPQCGRQNSVDTRVCPRCECRLR